MQACLLRLYRSLVPDSVPVILLTDRGFGRTEQARLRQQLSYHYLIRLDPHVWVRGPRLHRKLLHYAVKSGLLKSGLCRRLRDVAYSQNDPVRQQVVILTLAYALPVGLRHYCRAHLSSAYWPSNARPRDCSAFTIT